MIHTQHYRCQLKLTHYALAAYVDMRGLVTIEAVEEKAIRTWDIRNCRHSLRRQQGRFAVGHNLRGCRHTRSSTAADNGSLRVFRQAPHAFNSLQHRSTGPSCGGNQFVSALNCHSTIGLHVVDVSPRGHPECRLVEAPPCVQCLYRISTLVPVEARFFAFQRANPLGSSGHEGAQAEVTPITEAERPKHGLSKLDRKAIPQPLTPASPAKEPFAAELDPTQRASVHLTSRDLVHSDRRRKSTSPQLIA